MNTKVFWLPHAPAPSAWINKPQEIPQDEAAWADPN